MKLTWLTEVKTGPLAYKLQVSKYIDKTLGVRICE